MKKIVEVTGEGFEKFLGERITLFCVNYIYTGKLSGVNDTYLLLTDAGIVYETGAFTEKNWKDCQALPNDFYVMIQSIEGFGKVK